MIIIKPVEINDSNLTDTNVSESGVQEWEFDKTYEIGARVVKQYRSEWSTRTTPATNNFRSLVYGNGVWIAVSVAGDIMRSIDEGITWDDSPTAPASNTWRAVATDGAGTFVAVSSSGTNRAMYSTDDGVTWTASTPASNLYRAITYGAGLFVAVSSSGSSRVQTSPDGITWTNRTITLNDWRGIAWSESQTLFVAVSSSGVGNRAHTSPDGITWTSRTSAADQFWNCVVFGDGEFIALAAEASGAKVMTSPDGTNWTQRDDFAGYNIWSSIAYGNGEFVAVSSSGGPHSMSSRDKGITWIARDMQVNIGFHGVAFGNGKFIAVGSFEDIHASKGEHSIYESVKTANIGNWPDEDDLITPESWARVSATNRWAMFSDQISDATTRSSFEIEITAGVVIDALAFFGLEAETVQIVVDDGTERYNETYTLTENFLEEGVRQDKLVVLDLPTLYPDATITITFVDTGDNDPACGRLTMGNQAQFGLTDHGTGVGIADYSKKERDTFGNPVVIERNFAARADYTVTVNTVDVSSIVQVLGRRRVTPMAYIGEETIPATIIYGFYKDFSCTLTNFTDSLLNIEVEGLT